MSYNVPATHADLKVMEERLNDPFEVLNTKLDGITQSLEAIPVSI